MKRLLAMLMAVMMLCGVLAGCGGNETTNLEPVEGYPEEPYEIQWYLMADPQNDVASVEAELNAYLTRDLPKQ